MKTDELMCKLFDFSKPTYYKKKKEGNKAIKLIKDTFSNTQLLEYLERDSMQDLKIQQKIFNQFKYESYIKYFNVKKRRSKMEDSWNIFIKFYFQYLIDLSQYVDDEQYSNFSQSLFEFCFTYINKYNFNDDLVGITKATRLFEDWDDEMLIYLKYIIKNDLTPLLDYDDFYDEAVFHIIKYNLYKYKFYLDDQEHSQLICTLKETIKKIQKRDRTKKIIEIVQDIKNGNI